MKEGQKSNKIWLKILLVAFYLFIFAILLKNSFAYLDPDFGWHLKMGEQIWQTRTVPDINHEDYTLLGTHWVDYEWLSDLSTYLIYHNFGYIALSVAYALLMVIALIIQLQFTRKLFLQNDRGLALVLLLQAGGLYACLPHLGVRVQEITVLMLLILGIIVHLYNKNKDYRILFWLIPLFIFWASAHGGFLIGIFILGLFPLVKAVELWSASKFPLRFVDYHRVLNLKQILIFVGFSFLSLAATLATPYGIKLHLFLLGCRDGYYQSHLSEWLGQQSFPLFYQQLAYLEVVLIFLTLLFFAAFVFKANNRRQIDPYYTALILIFTFLALKARRHFPLLFIVSLPIMAEFFLNFFVFIRPRIMQGIGELRLFRQRGPRLGNLFLIFLSLVLVLVTALIALKINFTVEPEKTYQDKYPYQAISFLQAHPGWDNLNIFNQYGWGGYLIWQYPERKLFADGRLPEYPLAGRTVLQEYGDFFQPEKMVGQLKRYDIGLVVIDPNEGYPRVGWIEKYLFAINEKAVSTDLKKSFALLEYLRGASDWQSVYNDGVAEIFVIKK
jgi:hypothetical protein